MGVDYSEHLVGVAKEYFEQAPKEIYALGDVVTFAANAPHADQFTKVLCYGAFQYLSFTQAADLLKLLNERFVNVRRIFIGNLPDKALLQQFYRDRAYTEGMENDPSSMIGIWRTREEFADLAGECGWRVKFFKMSEKFYASHYRYDAVLRPKNEV